MKYERYLHIMAMCLFWLVNGIQIAIAAYTEQGGHVKASVILIVAAMQAGFGWLSKSPIKPSE